MAGSSQQRCTPATCRPRRDAGKILVLGHPASAGRWGRAFCNNGYAGHSKGRYFFASCHTQAYYWLNHTLAFGGRVDSRRGGAAGLRADRENRARVWAQQHRQKPSPVSEDSCRRPWPRRSIFRLRRSLPQWRGHKRCARLPMRCSLIGRGHNSPTSIDYLRATDEVATDGPRVERTRRAQVGKKTKQTQSNTNLGPLLWHEECRPSECTGRLSWAWPAS
ncbi:hypothetical protein CI41S_67560 [Bradyrhizobium ivorense]|nr:hypothetical protein CI41S_67560 [Bradyrhizobium ivorense]